MSRSTCGILYPSSTSSNVIVPYATFVERRERRRRVAFELSRRDAEGTIDAEAVAVCDPSRVKNAERTT